MSYNVSNAKLADCLNKLRVYDLNQLCRKFLLPQNGKKVAIIERILECITDVEREEQIYEFILATKPSIFEINKGKKSNNKATNSDNNSEATNNNKSNNNSNNSCVNNNVLCINNDANNHETNDTNTLKKNSPQAQKKGKVKIYEESHEFSSCICGGMVKNVLSKNCVVKCIECEKPQHISCYIQNSCISKNMQDYKILCVACRLKDMDPFYPLKQILWMKSLNTNSEKLMINASDIKSWKNENKEVIIFCIHADKTDLSGTVSVKQEWPKTFSLKVNGNVIEKIFEPSWEHKRRDSPLKITHVLHAGNNNIDINITNYDPPKLFVLAFLLCKIETEQSIIENIILNSSLSFKEAKNRIIHILSIKHDDDEVMCMEVNRKISLNCPFSLDRILIPCRGVKCSHIQCFDLKSFIDITKKTKAFNNRWKCPVCSFFLRPRHLVIDTFITYILSQVPKDIKEVELNKMGEIIFNHNNSEPKILKSIDDADLANLQKIGLEIKTEQSIDNNRNNDGKENNINTNEIIILDSDSEPDAENNENTNRNHKASDKTNLNNAQDGREVICISDSDDDDNAPLISKKSETPPKNKLPFSIGMANYGNNQYLSSFFIRNINDIDKINMLPNTYSNFNEMISNALNDIDPIRFNEIYLSNKILNPEIIQKNNDGKLNNDKNNSNINNDGDKEANEHNIENDNNNEILKNTTVLKPSNENLNNSLLFFCNKDNLLSQDMFFFNTTLEALSLDPGNKCINYSDIVNNNDTILNKATENNQNANLEKINASGSFDLFDSNLILPTTSINNNLTNELRNYLGENNSNDTNKDNSSNKEKNNSNIGCDQLDDMSSPHNQIDLNQLPNSENDKTEESQKTSEKSEDEENDDNEQNDDDSNLNKKKRKKDKENEKETPRKK
ncbi:E3 SUMO-protein ligase PIAS, putative [Plasmodium chabaudi chabaudi]|uniref:E3 SUMO-protein ligase PIAS, putative n=1 Tax=Plasmodium chabaudi chabaudi TaxID=31271 RepID=A0A1D3RZ46_PLACU|nr:E3 SUMO-protein ligase PIAS, putative [Plasmodium chabaudi chabaudi]